MEEIALDGQRTRVRASLGMQQSTSEMHYEIVHHTRLHRIILCVQCYQLMTGSCIAYLTPNVLYTRELSC